MQWDIMQAEEIEVQVQWSGYVGEDDCTTHQQWSGAQLDAQEGDTPGVPVVRRYTLVRHKERGK